MDSAIIDNYKRGSLDKYLKNNIDKGSKLSIISGYFTIYAYDALKEKLNDVKNANFLFGEPTFLKNNNIAAKRVFSIESKEAYRNSMLQRENAVVDLQYTINAKEKLTQKAVAEECAEWIRNKVNIKSIVKHNFLNGSMYHIDKSNGSQTSVMGSSNFTLNGLGLGQSKNIDMNLIVDSIKDIKDLKQWFDDIWNNEELVEDVKEQILQFIEQMYMENSPEFIYYLTLHTIFKEFLDEQNNSDLYQDLVGFKETKVWKTLYDFQKDAVTGAINKLNKYNGCIIADSVGLGKTFEALAVIKYYELKNYRVLVLCPKKLRDNWLVYRNTDSRNILVEDRFSYDVLNHTDLTRESGESGYINLSTINWDKYDLVVIDESHNFRNNKPKKGKKTRYSRLMEDIIRSGGKTKVLMLSATPVNNNLKDLKNQIYLATEGRNDALLKLTGIANIESTLRIGQQVFNKWASLPDKERTTQKLIESLNPDFFKLLDELTIARSRKHIKQYYNMKENGEFPERLKPISLYPEIDLESKFLSYEEIDKRISSLSLAIFSPTYYIKEEEKGKYKKMYDTIWDKRVSFSQEERESSLISMMKINYLKRLESSVNSFALSLDKLIIKIGDLIGKINSFIENSDKNSSIEIENTADFEDESSEDSIGTRIKIYLNDINLLQWKEALTRDKCELIRLYEYAKLIDTASDNKLCMLKQLIKNKIQNPINKNNKKVIIFTAYADTANYLYDALEQWCAEALGIHIGLVVGSGNNKTTFKVQGYKAQTEFNSILTNFSPGSKGRGKMEDMPKSGEIDILIATDCISEGQNLQDCDYLINYDIHWNPVRIVQRFGRIDRLGSNNKKIQLVNFWPTKDLNKYIKLKDKVESKMTLMDISATGDDNLLNIDKTVVMEDLEYRAKQLLKLKDGVIDLEDMNEGISITDFTLNDFRIDLTNFINENKHRLERVPLGMYAVVPALNGENVHFGSYLINTSVCNVIKPGVIYCLRKVKSTKGEKYNPLYPYYLAYVYEDGIVKFSYASTKQVLDIYRLLCFGKKEAYMELCNMFNKDTQNCKNMDKYSKLLDVVINNIRGKTITANLLSLRRDRRATLLNKNEVANDVNDFELISYLVLL